MTKTHFGPKTYLITGRVKKTKKIKMIRVYAYDAESAKRLARSMNIIPKTCKRIR